MRPVASLPAAPETPLMSTSETRVPAEDQPEHTTTPSENDQRFDSGAVVTIAGAHFTHDLYPAFLGPILPLLIEKHGMSLAIAGGLATVLRIPGIAQPVLGYYADRIDARLLVILPPLITAAAISLLGLSPSYFWLVTLLLVAGISSATFHPASGAMVTRASGGQWGRASSYYMTGGELGRALGPIFIASVVAAVGLNQMWIAAIPGAIISVITFTQLKRIGVTLGKAAKPRGLKDALSAHGRTITFLALVILFRSLVIASFQVFVPTYITGLGSSLIYAGLALTIYEAGGVAGAFVGGPLSDRFGRRTMMMVSQVTAGPILFGALILAQQPVGLVLFAVGGLLALCAGPVQLTLAQELLPENRSMATGIVMFLGFEGQVVATILMGILADMVGLGNALTWSVLLSMIALPFTALLPETRRKLA